MKPAKPKPQHRYRDSGTGRYVSAEYARANPKTTQRQRIAPRCAAAAKPAGAP
jgi:hypothetical protein